LGRWHGEEVEVAVNGKRRRWSTWSTCHTRLGECSERGIGLVTSTISLTTL
jgi:hypothetical protein